MFHLVLLLLLPVSSLAKPNVLFIVSDDMRPNLGAYANVNNGVFQAPQMYTPNLDKVSIFDWMINVRTSILHFQLPCFAFLFCSKFCWDTFPLLSWPRRAWCLSQPMFKMPSATQAEHLSWQVGGGWGLFWTFMPLTSLLEHLFRMALLAEAFDSGTYIFQAWHDPCEQLGDLLPWVRRQFHDAAPGEKWKLSLLSLWVKLLLQFFKENNYTSISVGKIFHNTAAASGPGVFSQLLSRKF